MRRFVRRLGALFRPARLDRDLEDEFAFHIDMRERELRASGLSDADARAAALKQFGNMTTLKERTRDVWVFPSIESVAQDVRFAVRGLRKSPAFAAVATATLALAIGGNAGIFSVIDALRAGALPYPGADRLVEIWGNVVRARVERRGASYPDFVDWQRQAKSFDAVSLLGDDNATLVVGAESERIGVEEVSSSYFGMLGVRPALGRDIIADDDQLGRPSVVVLSDDLWRRRFDADPHAIGRTLNLNGRAATVVGVAPPGFRGPSDQADAWIPAATSDVPDKLMERGNRGWVVLGRLAPGVSIREAQAELDAICRRLEASYPATNAKRGAEVTPLDRELFGDLRTALRALMVAVAFVLLIACANVANLLLARSEARQREIAVRTALGAGRRRLVRQLVTEALVLSSIGAAAGLLFADAFVRAVVAATPVTLPAFVKPALNLRVALFTAALTVGCAIVLGAAPVLHGRASRLADALKDSARAAGSRRSNRIRAGLIVAEVSLAVVLLVGAGLTIRTVQNLAALDLGFDADQVLSLKLSVPRQITNPPPAGPSELRPSVTLALERVRALPAVSAASVVTDMPLSGGGSAAFYTAEGQPPLDATRMPRAFVHAITPEFFATVRIPFVYGRTFNDAEMREGSNAVIVSERVATRFWSGRDPIGKRLKLGQLTSRSPWLHIVGVVREVKYRGVPENPTADPDLYFPFRGRNDPVSLVVRTSVPPATAAPAVRAAIGEVDSTIAIFAVAPVRELVARQTAPFRFTMWLMGIFAVCALALAVIGIYGVMSYIVTQRTREIGIRLALGASRADVFGVVLRHAVWLIAAGIGLGLLAAFGLQRFARDLLFGVSAADRATAASVLLLATAALAGCCFPAAHATRTDPLEALRHE